ncbi:hypothetical protein Cob_v000965 [Colletotrichum orbiculare MAFF 240422]|uniref:ABM domain-containing protein n=1 Tax=Colletotrichum orbiculare (strain 104-T / ATCC 96160 / CBS 514.97 / LARS 414 / MAFF 240422) TaxID=1213857 RepID=N4VK27_COLOR|nr:hypothetical protein Cob_v000965 [Colletotrichum orbiculare MAFF 240422]
MSAVTEFITLTLRNPSSSPSAITDVLSALKPVPGVISLHTGRQLENPSVQVVVITWASPEAFTSFAASSSYTPWFASLKALAAPSPAPVFYKVPFTPDPAAVLAAPCTEVFIAYGAEPGFVGQTEDFARGLGGAPGPVPGFHGHAYGEVSTPLGFGADGDQQGPAVTLLLGWDSKEAHMEAKGKPGPISDNIHLLRTGRKDIAMYHVNLEQV